MQKPQLKLVRDDSKETFEQDHVQHSKTKKKSRIVEEFEDFESKLDAMISQIMRL